MILCLNYHHLQLKISNYHLLINYILKINKILKKYFNKIKKNLIKY